MQEVAHKLQRNANNGTPWNPMFQSTCSCGWKSVVTNEPAKLSAAELDHIQGR